MNTNANQPAYPCEQGTDPNGNWNQTFESGLSKREYIAALALQAILSNNAAFTKYAETYAKQAVVHTDALLKELE